VDELRAKLTTAFSGTPIEKEYHLVDDGIRRTEALVTKFDAAAYDARAVAVAREGWTFRMAAEHRSTAVFGALALQLIEANASLDSKVVMLRMAQDELRHTETCAEVVRALGGEGVIETDVSVAPLATHRGTTPEERALRNVIYTTCLSEMIAVARLVDEVEATSDPFLRDATRRLLADEVLHGQFGFHYLEASRPWLEQHPEVVRSLERYLTHAFAVLESALVSNVTSMRALTDDERALGMQPPERGREVFYETMQHAIVPGLERFGIDARTAWRTRRRLDGEAELRAVL
jgi:hypothetical protein